MVVIIAQALFFFLPAFIANMFPVVFTNVSFLQRFKRPVDGGMKLGRSVLFGEHKTYFGFLVGVSGAIVTGLLQAALFVSFDAVHWLYFFPYSFSLAAFLGFLLGFGALLGDLLKSFIKRRLRLKSGAPFFPFDQLDFVAGGLVLGAVVYLPSFSHILVLVILTPLLHLFSNFIGYKMGLKKVWW